MDKLERLHETLLDMQARAEIINTLSKMSQRARAELCLTLRDKERTEKLEMAVFQTL